jgi:formylglycine-generating enzyme required for sulfatase activity
MTGNTWEWTSSLYQNYPYKFDDGRENAADDTAHRVVRGGSWYDNSGVARVSSRRYVLPGGRSDNLGVRVVCASPMNR